MMVVNPSCCRSELRFAALAQTSPAREQAALLVLQSSGPSRGAAMIHRAPCAKLDSKPNDPYNFASDAGARDDQVVLDRGTARRSVGRPVVKGAARWRYV